MQGAILLDVARGGMGSNRKTPKVEKDDLPEKHEAP